MRITKELGKDVHRISEEEVMGPASPVKVSERIGVLVGGATPIVT